MSLHETMRGVIPMYIHSLRVRIAPKVLHLVLLSDCACMIKCVLHSLGESVVSNVYYQAIRIQVSLTQFQPN